MVQKPICTRNSYILQNVFICFHKNRVRLKSQGWLFKLYRRRYCSGSLVLTLSHLARLAFIEQISVKYSLGLDESGILTRPQGYWSFQTLERRYGTWILWKTELSNKMKSRGLDQSLYKKPKHAARWLMLVPLYKGLWRDCQRVSQFRSK